MGRLQDKVAIVTGGGQGIGRAESLILAKEGASIVVAQRTLAKAEGTAAEIVKMGGKAIAVACDVQDQAQVDAMVKKAVDAFGKVNILVNNAAFFGGIGYKRWDAWTTDEWQRSYMTNVVGPWQCAKAVFPHMKAQKKGKIINTYSTTANMGFAGLIPYTTSKAAVHSLTKCLARALGRYNIGVNTVSPGYVLTDASLQMPGHSDEGDKKLIETRCFQRPSYAEDLQGPVLFLASDDSDFVTGQLLIADGGDTML
jgi:NAD(P)-dependent dehydrogenase (short-subunit alcohol dehydrogenase family)